MMLYKLEFALKLANALPKGKLRICCDGVVTEFTGNNPAQRACSLYGHYPVKRVKAADGYLNVHICSRPGLAKIKHGIGIPTRAYPAHTCLQERRTN